MKKNGVVPFFQPVHDTFSGRLIGAEILARLSLGGGCLVPPAIFMPLITTQAATELLTKMLLARAGEWLRRVSLPEKFWLSFNIPPDTLGEYWLAEHCCHIADCASNRVTLVAELTETSILSLDKVKLEDGLYRLREAGVKLALDDFGTGYSSYQLLQQTRADIIKIPREFVLSQHQCRISQAVITNIMALSMLLELEVIAEGVESSASLAALRHIGVRMVQGYYFSPPLSPVAMSDYLRRNGSCNES